MAHPNDAPSYPICLKSLLPYSYMYFNSVSLEINTNHIRHTTHNDWKKKLKSTIFLFTDFCAMNDHRKHCLFNTKPGGSHHKNTPLPPTGEVLLPVYLFQHHAQAKIKPDLFCKTRWAGPGQVRSSSLPSPVRHPVHSGSKRPDRESRNNTTPGRCQSSADRTPSTERSCTLGHVHKILSLDSDHRGTEFRKGHPDPSRSKWEKQYPDREWSFFQQWRQQQLPRQHKATKQR